MKKLLVILAALLCLNVSAFAEETAAQAPEAPAAEEAAPAQEPADKGLFMKSLTDGDDNIIAEAYMDELPDDSELIYDAEGSDDGMWTLDIEGVANIRIFISQCMLKNAAGVSLADVQGENLQQLTDMATVDYDDPVVEILTTPSGNQYMHIYERDEELRSVCTMFTLYKGAVIELVQFNDDFSPLTEHDHEVMEDVLYSIWIYEVK